MNIRLAAALASLATLALAGAAQAAPTYSFVITPVLGGNGQPLADDAGRVDGRTFNVTVGATETPTATYSALFKYPNYFVKAYTYTEFGSTAVVTVPATLGKNVEFFDYTNQGGLFLTNSGNRNFELFGDTVNGDTSEVLYDDVAYKAALATNASAQPAFKLGTFLLSTYPRNSSPTQPIQNYRVIITSDAAPAALPEPASWAAMMTGLGAAGTTLRRRRRTGLGLA